MIKAACWPGRVLGYHAVGVDDPDELEKDDLLVLWGGEDIATELYGEQPWHTRAGKMSWRDETERELSVRAKELGIPILGICRGAQLLCALDGGALYQHVGGHGRNHLLVTHDGQKIESNSAHHQMMIPRKENKILAWCEHILSPRKWRNSPEPIISMDPEPEIVFFPEWNALGVQGHPEWLSNEHNLVKLTKQYLKEFLCYSLN